MTRTCKKCGAEKELNAEHFRLHRHGMAHTCLGCSRAANRAYHRANPEKVKNIAHRCRSRKPQHYSQSKRNWYARNREKVQKQIRIASLNRKYGVSPEAYAEMLARQAGGCAICEVKPEDAARKRLQVDHCHETGRVRGLLCRTCNLLLGYAQDRPLILSKAAAYLQPR